LLIGIKLNDNIKQGKKFYWFLQFSLL
jgi:hypothetical protein